MELYLQALQDHPQKRQGPLQLQLEPQRSVDLYRFFVPSPALAQSRAHCPEPSLLERRSMDWLMPIQTCFEPAAVLSKMFLYKENEKIK
jgi:hypothetical protein